MSASAVSLEACREIHDRERREQGEERDKLWAAIKTVEKDVVDVRLELGKLAVKVGLICGISAGVFSWVPSILMWLRG